MIRFEQLAKDLAGGMKRREAFRRIGGGLAGALLASFGVGRARHSTSGTSARVRIAGDCGKIYGPGFAQAECFADCEFCAAGTGGNCILLNYSECEGAELLCAAPPRARASAPPVLFCEDLPTCATSADCPTGWFCSANTCCIFDGFPPVCLPPCSTNPFGFDAEAKVKGGATTFGM